MIQYTFRFEDQTQQLAEILDSLADSVELSIELSLKQLRPLFDAYLGQC